MKYLGYLALIAIVVAGFWNFRRENTHVYAYDAQACAGESNKQECLSTLYTSLVQNFGVPTAIQDIEKRAGEDAGVSAICHPLVHMIGMAATDKYPTVSEAFAHGDPYCWSGYYHGAMEGIIAKIGEENLPSKLNSICADIPDKAKYGFNYYNCVHGLGHGIMELKGDELPDSLAMCDTLTGNWEEQSCQSGAYMENVMVNERFGSAKYLKPSDPIYPCDIVGDQDKFQCYLGQTSYALKVYNYDFSKVFAICATVKGSFRDVCNQSTGRDAANQAMHDNIRTKNTCYLTTNANDRKNCVIGAVKEFVSYYHSDTQAKDFCNTLDTSDKQTCLQTATEYYKLF